MHTIFAPELFTGVSSDAERATALATESLRLAVGGLTLVLKTTAEELRVTKVTELRSAKMRPQVIISTRSIFDQLYDALEAHEAGVLNQIPQAFTAVRRNPLEDTSVLFGITHHKHQLRVGDITAEYPLPFWVRQSGITNKKLGDLDLGFRRHIRT